MTRYLILADAAAADERSRAAWTPGPGDTITVRLWEVLSEPEGTRAALVVPEETVGILSEAEQAGLQSGLPWGGGDSV